MSENSFKVKRNKWLKNSRTYLAYLLLMLILPHFGLAQLEVAKGGYGDMLYPYEHEYDQLFVYKIGVDYCPQENTPKLNADDVLEVIRKIDNISRGIPKMVYLVGWQYRGHDTGYPSFSEVNPALKRLGDSSALESLKWLIREAIKYNTQVSFHVNFSDVYLDDNILGPVYKDRDIIVRLSNGSYHEGYKWCDHMAYRASNYRNWNQDTFREKQIKPLFEMVPELLETASIHPDAWYNTSDPFYRITDEEDCEAMREMTTWVRQQYNVDITTEFDRRRPKDIDFVLFHPLLWHIGWDERTPPDPMKIPSYFQAGVNAKTWSSGAETVQSKYFGEIGDFESIIRKDFKNLPGVVKEFATRTLPWYFLNRQLRTSFDGNTARFTGNIETSYPGKYTIKKGNAFLQDGDDVFIPALWKPQKEIIAYSANGYKDHLWNLPKNWLDISKVDIYNISFEGHHLKQKDVRIKNNVIKLSLSPNEAVFIIPAGANPNNNAPASPSGKVEFAEIDTESQGNWKGKYGDDGWHIVGEKSNLQIMLT